MFFVYVLGFGCSAVLILFVVVVLVCLLLFVVVFVVMLFLCYCCCCFVIFGCFCYCCFVFVVFVACLPKNTAANQQKTTKTLVSLCFLPFVPGRVLPRETPTTQNQKITKGLFVFPPLLSSLLCFLLYVFHSFLLFLFLSLFICFCFFGFFFLIYLPFMFSLPCPSNFKEAAKTKETMK